MRIRPAAPFLKWTVPRQLIGMQPLMPFWPKVAAKSLRLGVFGLFRPALRNHLKRAAPLSAKFSLI